MRQLELMAAEGEAKLSVKDHLSILLNIDLNRNSGEIINTLYR